MNVESDEQLWDVRDDRDGTDREAVTTEQLRYLISKGMISVEDFARRSPHGQWRQIGTLDVVASTVSGSRRRRRQTVGDEDDFDMTPMIDVTFLLLIFFMVTASFHFQKGLDFPASDNDQPETSSDQPAPGLDQFDDRILVRVSDIDEYTFADPSNPNNPGQPIESTELATVLEQKSREERKSKLLIVSGDRSSHEAVVALIDAASSVGIVEIGMANIVGPSTVVIPTIPDP